MIRLALCGLAVMLCMSSEPAHCYFEARSVEPPISFFLFCMRYPAECENYNDRRINNFLSRGQRWRELNQTNVTVNFGIVSETSARSRRDYDWSIFPYDGNCADYAVTKRHLLLQFGWPSSSLLLAEVVVRASGEHHLVLLAKEARDVFVLDNLDTLVMRLDEALGRYALVRVQSGHDPHLWTRAIAASL
jgi:predicted transglutaminase-like cysteine proteinase